jgi:hypothetical protein
VDLLPLAAATPEHLGTYAAMDVSLDPFPYAGTTTTCESLYMGEPLHPCSQSSSCHFHVDPAGNVRPAPLQAVLMHR